MAHTSGNPTWADYPSTTTLITAASLENIENAIDGVPRQESGQLFSTLNSGSISLTGTTPNFFTHTFTTTVAGKINIRQNIQFSPQPNQGTANRTTVAPTLAGIDLVRASDSAVLVSDRNWSEGFCLDTGFGLYGLCNLSTECQSDTVLPAGNYIARAAVWSVQGTGAPRVFVQRLKTKWRVTPA